MSVCREGRGGEGRGGEGRRGEGIEKERVGKLEKREKVTEG